MVLMSLGVFVPFNSGKAVTGPIRALECGNWGIARSKDKADGVVIAFTETITSHDSVKVICVVCD